jgi:hypothetical protein
MHATGSYMKTSFQVRLFRSVDENEPFVILPITAKMPLSAMVIAMQQARVSHADYVTVRWEDPDEGTLETEFYHVKINRTHITYDRALVVKEEQAQERNEAHKDEE